jgi:predicted CoA-binding protein
MSKFTVKPTEVMGRYKVIAVVGASKNPDKEAFTVPAYLQQHGYTIIPVNPTTDMVNGMKSYPTLADIPDDLAKKVDVVEVFRPSEELPEIAMQVAKMKEKTGRPFVFWGQLGLENDDAKKILAKARVDYVMDKCMRVEHQAIGRPARE